MTHRWPKSAEANHGALLAAMIGTFICTVACFVALTGASSPLVAAEPGPAKLHWLRGIDAALKRAEKLDRDVLINFTGHGWCYACEVLDRDVLTKPEFATVADDFVLVELDFPQTDDSADVDAATLKKYREWQAKYLTPGVPTVVLVDSRGLPFAYTGYTPGITPASFLNELARYRAARTRRDRAMRDAAHETGPARAGRLDAALENVAPLLGSLSERNGDPLLTWYGDTVREICKLDGDDALGLRSKYERRQEDLRLFGEYEGIFEKLKTIKSNPEALAYIATVLPTVTDAKMAWRLERSRQIRLEHDDQNEAALANARRLLNRSDLTRDQRDDLKDRIAFNLKNLSRFSEAVAQLDELIAANEDRPARQLSHLDFKAFCLQYAADAGADRGPAVVAFREWRERCKPGSDDWQTASRTLGIQLQKSDRFEEALALRRELAEREAQPHFLLDLTETYLSLGKVAEAAKTLSDGERLIQSMPSDRQDDKQAVDWLTARAAVLKAQLKSAE